MEQKALTIQANGLDLSSPALIQTLKQTVAKGATDEEFAMFVEFCKGTGLNPFKKEVWFIKTGGGVQLMTGINGFYAVANNHPQFDGIETVTTDGEDGMPIKCTCSVYRKDRSRPTTAEAYFVEYRKGTPIWKSMPRVMLSKCAESMALRKAFSQELNGVYSAEEMPPDYSNQNAVDVTPAPRKGNGSETPWVVDGDVHYYDFSNIDPEKLDWLQKNRLHPMLEEGVDCECLGPGERWAISANLGPKFAKYQFDPSSGVA